MVIKLYVNNSDPKAVDKTLTAELDISGTARDSTNIVNPVIDIEGDVVQSIGQYNYLYIEDFARYYFIESITGNNYNLSTLNCRVDILMSSKQWLRARYATITRNENLYNSYIMDTNFSAYAYRNIVTKKFPNAVNLDSIILMTVG